MRKLAAFALASLVGTAAVGLAKPAEAGVYVGVGIPLPGIQVVAPAPVLAYPGVYAPYYYGYPHYYRPGVVRYPYGFYRGHGYVGRWR